MLFSIISVVNGVRLAIKQSKHQNNLFQRFSRDFQNLMFQMGYDFGKMLRGEMCVPKANKIGSEIRQKLIGFARPIIVLNRQGRRDEADTGMSVNFLPLHKSALPFSLVKPSYDGYFDAVTAKNPADAV